MKLKNLYLGIKDQFPFLRLLKNIWSGNVFGLFYLRSHINSSGNLKISYPTKESAIKAALAMQKKNGYYYSNYKCIFCDGYHIGRNRDNK